LRLCLRGRQLLRLWPRRRLLCAPSCDSNRAHVIKLSTKSQELRVRVPLLLLTPTLEKQRL
jgi:hypothetical protein